MRGNVKVSPLEKLVAVDLILDATTSYVKRGVSLWADLCNTCGLRQCRGGAGGQSIKRSELVGRAHGFFVRDGGNWIADNAGYVPNGTAPKQVGYEYRWTFNNSAVETPYTAFWRTASGVIMLEQF